MSIHQFFQEQGFLYVHTPVVRGEATARALGQMFRVSTLIPPSRRLRLHDGICNISKQDFFGHGRLFSTVSGQLEAEIFACSLRKVYTFGSHLQGAETPQYDAPLWPSFG